MTAVLCLLGLCLCILLVWFVCRELRREHDQWCVDYLAPEYDRLACESEDRRQRSLDLAARYPDHAHFFLRSAQAAKIDAEECRSQAAEYRNKIR